MCQKGFGDIDEQEEIEKRKGGGGGVREAEKEETVRDKERV